MLPEVYRCNRWQQVHFPPRNLQPGTTNGCFLHGRLQSAYQLLGLLYYATHEIHLDSVFQRSPGRGSECVSTVAHRRPTDASRWIRNKGWHLKASPPPAAQQPQPAILAGKSTTRLNNYCTVRTGILKEVRWTLMLPGKSRTWSLNKTNAQRETHTHANPNLNRSRNRHGRNLVNHSEQLHPG